jgi:hypothetical protein
MHPHAIIAATRATEQAFSLASTSLQQHHVHKLSRLKVEIVALATTKVTEFQLLAIQESCLAVMSAIAQEYALYRDEYAKDADLYRATADVVLRAELDSRLDKGSRQMARLLQAGLALHAATAGLLAHAAQQLLNFTGDFTIQVPRELREAPPPPVVVEGT